MRLLWAIRIGLPAVLTVVGCAAFVESFDFPPLARYFPLVVSAMLTLLCLAIVIVNVVKVVRDPAAALKVGGSNDTSGLLVGAWLEGPAETAATRRRVGLSLLVLAGAIISMAVLGAVLGMGVFIAVAQWKLVRARWWVVAGSALATSALVWLISAQFRLRQPAGLLGEILGYNFGLR